jgi:1,4-dihydroxy-2-naphthoate octaprenyltransferase
MLLQVFINTELYARVSVAVLFHQLWKQIKENNISETEEALQSGKLTIAYYLGHCCLKLILSGHHLVFDS